MEQRDWRQMCNWYGVNLMEAEACPDHIHMLIAIPPKYSVSHTIKMSPMFLYYRSNLLFVVFAQ